MGEPQQGLQRDDTEKILRGINLSAESAGLALRNYFEPAKM